MTEPEAPGKLSERDELIAEIRTAVADYMRSEGCSCCRDSEAHRINAARLAKLLKVPAYPDRSGFKFGKFETRENGHGK